jgi:hypothetical protein
VDEKNEKMWYSSAMSPRSLSHKAWVVSVNMGYGHERAAFGLEELACGGIITANDYPGIPKKDRELWKKSRELYEAISRVQGVPWIGPKVFAAMDHFQRIAPFYPRRDLSARNIQIAEMYYLIQKHGLGRHLIEKLSEKPLPFVSTFFLPAYAAEVHGYPGDIYIVACDADVFRTWAPLDPKKSRIKYFAPNGRVVERLKLYGVRPENIFLTGFPLPKKNVGGAEGTIIKPDLAARLCNLDPNRNFIDKYARTLDEELGQHVCKQTPNHPLTLTFSVGGAGAQRRIGWQILESLRTPLLQKRLRLNMEAGTHVDIARVFTQVAKNYGLKRVLGTYLNIHAYSDRPTYFRSFAHTLRSTDILWTKPSELSFYTGLGLPIIIAPPIGSQEDFNKTWLETVNGGINQMDPRYVNEWLFDWVDSGGLARFAWDGYIEAPTHGAYRIESILTGEKVELPVLPLIV